MAPNDIRTLTPAKLAAFYKAVGGDLDGESFPSAPFPVSLSLSFRRTDTAALAELFLGTPTAKLSDIYSTLGCAHSLQPVPGNDFLPPSIPALSQRGFAIWQTIQLLLDPEEHVPYIQEAVRNFHLRDPETGEPFPREIPAEAFPRHTDVETERWHNEAFARKNAEKKKREMEERAKAAVPPPEPTGISTGIAIESEEEDWTYRPRRKHRHRHTPYEEPLDYSRSAPGAHDTHGHSYRSSARGHRHHHSYSHPEAYGHVDIKTPVASDMEDELYAPRHSRHTSHGHSQTRHGYSSHSHSRSRQPSREFLKAGYVYTADRDPVVIEPYVPIATTVEPTATYIRPSEAHLHAYHSVPGMHYSPTPQPTEDDLRSRFLRHRSSSPVSRAPLGAVPTSGKSRSRVYVEDEYEPSLVTDQYYADDDVLAAQEEERRREKDEDKRRRRRREKEREKEREHDRKEHAYIHAHPPGYRNGAGVYYS